MSLSIVPITTIPIPIDDSNTYEVGVLTHTPIITNRGNHHCFTWTIGSFYSYLTSGRYYNSPIFTVSDKNECKWYLSIQSLYDRSEDNSIFLSLHLVLDRKSDCKEAVAKFDLSILGSNYEASHECNLKLGRTFKFATNFENKAGILSSIGKNKFSSKQKIMYWPRWPPSTLTIVCDIMIETIFHEDSDLSNEFGYLLKNQLFADIVLSVGEKKYPVHKAILASRSSVFAAMFAHNMIEKEGTVHIKDMDEEVVEEMLRYIYTGKVEKFENIAQGLLIAADKYCLEKLGIMCEDVLAANLSGSNALDLLVFAKRYNFNGLKSKTIDFILSRRTKIEKTEAWEGLGESDVDLLKVLCEGFLDF